MTNTNNKKQINEVVKEAFQAIDNDVAELVTYATQSTYVTGLLDDQFDEVAKQLVEGTYILYFRNKQLPARVVARENPFSENGASKLMTKVLVLLTSIVTEHKEGGLDIRKEIHNKDFINDLTVYGDAIEGFDSVKELSFINRFTIIVRVAKMLNEGTFTYQKLSALYDEIIEEIASYDQEAIEETDSYIAANVIPEIIEGIKAARDSEVIREAVKIHRDEIVELLNDKEESPSEETEEEEEETKPTIPEEVIKERKENVLEAFNTYNSNTEELSSFSIETLEGIMEKHVYKYTDYVVELLNCYVPESFNEDDAEAIMKMTLIRNYQELAVVLNVHAFELIVMRELPEVLGLDAKEFNEILSIVVDNQEANKAS